jgi:hypothetical protein
MQVKIKVSQILHKREFSHVFIGFHVWIPSAPDLRHLVHVTGVFFNRFSEKKSPSSRNEKGVAQ